MRFFFVPSLRISYCFADCSTFCFPSLFSPLVRINAVFRLWHAGVALVASVRKIAGTVHSLRLADLKKVHLAQRCAGCFSPRSPPSQLISMRLTHPQQNKVKIITKALFFLCLYPYFRLRSASHSAWSSLSYSVDAVNERRGGWAGRQQHHSRSSLHQHPQTDHVRAHVPENADASHRPGWALRWRTGPACGLSGMRQTPRATWTIVWIISPRERRTT